MTKVVLGFNCSQDKTIVIDYGSHGAQKTMTTMVNFHKDLVLSPSEFSCKERDRTKAFSVDDFITASPCDVRYKKHALSS